VVVAVPKSVEVGVKVQVGQLVEVVVFDEVTVGVTVGVPADVWVQVVVMDGGAVMKGGRVGVKVYPVPLGDGVGKFKEVVQANPVKTNRLDIRAIERCLGRMLGLLLNVFCSPLI
jgi:hypothetical protein